MVDSLDSTTGTELAAAAWEPGVRSTLSLTMLTGDTSSRRAGLRGEGVRRSDGGGWCTGLIGTCPCTSAVRGFASPGRGGYFTKGVGIVSRREAITASDDELREVLQDAVLPPLIVALAHVTGDLSLLRDDLRIDPTLIAEPQGGLTDEQQAVARDLAFDVLRRYRDAGSPPAAPPSEHDLVAMMEFATGTEVMREYVPLLEEELGVTGEDRRAPGWTQGRAGPRRPVRGGRSSGPGMSGLLAAYRLQQAGVPFVVFEKDDEVGGTWWENTYPGCRVDNPSHNYSYSFAQRARLADALLHPGRARRVLPRLRRRARSAPAHPVRHRGRVGDVVGRRSPAGRCAPEPRTDPSTHVQVDAVISATGQLNRPHLPEIPGRDTFAGPAFHSARWPAGPRPRREAGGRHRHRRQRRPVHPDRGRTAPPTLVIFQRTPAWFAPTPDYHAPVEDGLRWLYRHVPYYSEWNRFWIFWTMGDGQLGVRHRRPGVGAEGHRRQRNERRDAGPPHGLPRGAVRRPSRPPRQGGAVVPSRQQARVARQRRLGRGAHPRHRRARHDGRPGDHSERGASVPTGATTTSTSSSTAPASWPRSSSPR